MVKMNNAVSLMRSEHWISAVLWSVIKGWFRKNLTKWFPHNLSRNKNKDIFLFCIPIFISTNIEDNICRDKAKQYDLSIYKIYKIFYKNSLKVSKDDYK